MKTVSNLVERDVLLGVVLSVPGENGKWICYESADEVPEKYKPQPLTLADQQAAIAKEYDSELMAHYDRIAQTQGFDDMTTCMLRASRPGPFYAQGAAYFDWVERCNVLGYTLITEVKAGAKPLPSKSDFITNLPPMVWPD